MRRLLGAALLAAVVCGRARAEDWTWARALEAARGRNPDLSAARAQLEGAEARLRSSYSGFLPQVGAEAVAGGSDGGSGAPAQDDYSAGLTLQQSLFAGGKTRADVDAARAQLDAARAELTSAESQVRHDLRAAFLRALFAQENGELAGRIAARRKENRDLIGLRYEAGRENRGALLRAAAQLSQAELEMRRAGRELGLALKDLSRLMGSDGGAEGRVRGGFEVRTGTAAPDFALLADSNARLRRQRAALALAQAGVRQARSQFFPDLSFSAAGRRRGADFPPDSDSWSVAGRATYPLSSGGRDRWSLRQARSESGRAAAVLEALRREVELGVRASYSDFQDALERVAVERQFLTASEERAAIGRAQYSNGLIPFQDWDIVENDLIAAQKQALTAERDAALAEAAWHLSQAKGFDAP